MRAIFWIDVLGFVFIFAYTLIVVDVYRNLLLPVSLGVSL
jgi:hypothetical protein